MKPGLKRIFLIAWIILVGGPLIYACMFIGVAGRWGCMGTRYERFDFFKNGVLQELIRDGSPTLSIMQQKISARSDKAYSAVYNVTELTECARDEKYAGRISYVELRSASLTEMVARWHTHHDPDSGFRSGNIWKDRVKVSHDADGPNYQVWDPAYVKATAPEWVPLAQLNEATVIAFWGDGHLFKGSKPNQYYWIGYR
jgi:hypothetical protein